MYNYNAALDDWCKTVVKVPRHVLSTRLVMSDSDWSCDGIPLIIEWDMIKSPSWYFAIAFFTYTQCNTDILLLAPRMGAYNLTSVRTSVRTYVGTSMDSDFSEVYGSTGLKL